MQKETIQLESSSPHDSTHISQITIQPRFIDVEVQKMFKTFENGQKDHLTRKELAQFLTQIFKQFNIGNHVSDNDVTNFLKDYDILHQNDLVRQDFKGITKLRFTLHQIPTTKVKAAHNFNAPVYQVIVPVQMIFDYFDKHHEGFLSRKQVKSVLNFIFKDFGLKYEITDEDVNKFLKDIEIWHEDQNKQITKEDFKGYDKIKFDIHYYH